jgi:hypothetical protein
MLKNDFDVEYFLKQAELMRPRSQEEIAESEAELDRKFKQYVKRNTERRRVELYRKLAAQPKPRFFGIKIGWWY